MPKGLLSEVACIRIAKVTNQRLVSGAVEYWLHLSIGHRHFQLIEARPAMHYLEP